MFAVPGWSVAAEGLKTETQVKKASNTAKNESKKRKRANKQEKKEKKAPTSGANSVLVNPRVFGEKREDAPPATAEADHDGDDADEAEAETPKPSKKQKKEKKESKSDGGEKTQETPKSDKKGKKQRKEMSNNEDEPATPAAETTPSKTSQKAALTNKQGNLEKKKNQDAAAAIAASVLPVPPAAAKLTPLQRSMRQKLISARFRHLNETLYTRPSAQAYQLFEDSPEMFSEYHEGFRRQVEVWPSNPVDGYIRDIKLRARAGFPNARGGGRPGGAPSKPDGPQPLPRTDGTCYVADLGCGDARLASTLEPESKKLKLKIMSYDLHSPAKHVTKADIANLPLENDSVDVAIFCLALMGTNWLDFIEEAYRILHWKGELWIAEIKSRFGPVHRKNAVVSHSVGNRKKAAAAAAGKKTKEPEETEEDRTALAVEVDGHEDKRGETDVSAFVEALRKRGFVLAGQGEGNKGAVDLSNKMFVKMHFIKGAVPTKGKGLVAAKAAGYVDKEKKQKRFVWETEEDKVDETGILKPCVYKIR
ncbi:methyltransferase domain-containing protein [Colletotrichum cuscutae]|uniref:Ribosomal RNA-processing protein 8 n=1 Tax=Colletotrichum cuscutae TaxID=1209917 RepID=A0AAI9VDH2_9PEZI|nr:methyltransferase domain-containing protein [Colletotrichum cuscutae]